MRELISNKEDGDDVESSHTIMVDARVVSRSGQVDVNGETFKIIVTYNPRGEEYGLESFEMKDLDGKEVEADDYMREQIIEVLEMSEYQETEF